MPDPAGLPAFPWDALAPAAARAAAAAGADGAVDLSVGTPVDPVPEVIRRALAAAADAPGYPSAAGTPGLRAAAAAWCADRLGATVDPAHVLPLAGAKELVALLPWLLDLAGRVVVIPELAYPTYEVGAALAGARAVRGTEHPAPALDGAEVDPGDAALVWVNSPANPTGRVLGVRELRDWLTWARERGAVLASDECYVEFAADGPAAAVSILDPRVCGGDHQGLLAVHSLSKRSNLAGYRSGFVTGDPVIVERLRQLRRQIGWLMPAPIQAASAAAWRDAGHVLEQRVRYARRREVLVPALQAAGFQVDPGSAGLYLWATHPELGDCWAQVDQLADRGVLVAPGVFYGPAGRAHVRVALTATDVEIARAAERIGQAVLR